MLFSETLYTECSGVAKFGITEFLERFLPWEGKCSQEKFYD